MWEAGKEIARPVPEIFVTVIATGVVVEGRRMANVAGLEEWLRLCHCLRNTARISLVAGDMDV